MRVCAYCTNELKKRQKKYCSHKCASLGLRGSGDSHIRILVDDPENPGQKKREYLHRVVFGENYRPLAPGEIVHHIDENKHNNDPRNLEALSGQAAHLLKHDYFRGRRRSKTLSQNETEALEQEFAEFGF